jgi:hypothetical protein
MNKVQDEYGVSGQKFGKAFSPELILPAIITLLFYDWSQVQ